MAKNETSQPQQIAFEMFAQFTKDHIARVNAWAGQVAEIESASHDYAADLMARGPKLAAQWREQMVESTKAAAKLWTAQV